MGWAVDYLREVDTPGSLSLLSDEGVVTGRSSGRVLFSELRNLERTYVQAG